MFKAINIDKIKRYKLEIIFLIILLYLSSLIYKSFFGIIGDGYAHSELFINYETGFTRRGLLGQIFFIFNNQLDISYSVFFPTLYAFLYLLFFFYFYKLVKSWDQSLFLIILISLSPALILFPVYEENVYFTKDIFIKLTILIHSVLLVNNFKKKDGLKKYLKQLNFILIPLVIIVTLIHELQVIFLSIHLLFTYTAIINYKASIRYNYFIYYFPIIIIFLILVFVSGNEQLYLNQSELLKEKFDIKIHPQLKGGIDRALGNFFIWHFYYFEFDDFVNTFLSFIFSFYLIYVFFQYLINKKVFSVSKNIDKNYKFFFIPSFITFLLTDHGRSISFLAVHLVCFYFVLKVNNQNFQNLFDKFNKNFLLKQVSIIFCLFYIGFWSLSQTAGLGVREKTSVFRPIFFIKISNATKNTYNFLRKKKIFDLPDIEKKIAE